MRNLLLITAIILLVVCFAGAACFYLFCCLVVPVDLSRPSEDFVTASEKPMSLEEARQRLMFPLPDGAKNIMYVNYSEWIAHEFMLKFEAPLDVCKQHAQLLIEDYNQDNPDDVLPVELHELDEPLTPVAPTPPTNVTWFDIDNIKNGFFGGSIGSHTPTIWIDTDRGILYYRETD